MYNLTRPLVRLLEYAPDVTNEKVKVEYPSNKLTVPLEKVCSVQVSVTHSPITEISCAQRESVVFDEYPVPADEITLKYHLASAALLV